MFPGKLGDTARTLHVTNSTPILLHETSNGWTMLPWSLAHTDGEGRSWTLTMAGSQWSVWR